MPSKSPAQKRFMAAAAHSPGFAKKAGIPQGVAEEFSEADTAEQEAREPDEAGKRKKAQALVAAMRKGKK